MASKPKRKPPRPLPFPGYLTPEQRLKLAGQRADTSLLPAQQNYAKQREAIVKQTAWDAQQANEVAKAIAQIAKEAGPATEQAYRTAGADQATFAKGYSDGMRLKAQQNADQTNSTLRAIGVDDRVVGAANKGADVAYGLGGVVPATAMSREGAAFTAAANNLPAYALMRGQYQAGQIQAGGAKQLSSLEQDLRDLEAKRPGIIQQMLDQIERNQLQNRSQYANEKYLNIKLAGDNTRDDQRTAAEWTRINGYKSDANGDPVYDSQGELIPVASSTKANKAARQKAVANRSAAIGTARKAVFTAASAWTGKPVKNPKPDSYRNPGQYLDPNGNGTNDPNKAAKTGGLTWEQAMARAYALVADDLMGRFNMTPAAIKKMIRAQLIAAGLSPGGR